MRDQLKNEFLLLLNAKVSSEDLRVLSTQLDLILSNYEIAPRNTELIPYGSDIPKTVEIYIVSKKIWALFERRIYAEDDNHYCNAHIFIDRDICKRIHTGKVGETVYDINTPMASRVIPVYDIRLYVRYI